MNIIAFVLAVIAAVIFLFLPDGQANRPGWLGQRSGVALGLFFLTVALIVEFIAKSHTVTCC